MDRVEFKAALIIIVMLAFVAGVLVTYSWAEPAKKVIGECTVKKGTDLFSFYKYGEIWEPFVAKAFKDQKVYIFTKDDRDKIYIGDGFGFSHHCPHHGEEILKREGKLRIPFNAPGLECHMFQTQ